METWNEPICCCKCKFSVFPRDSSKLDSIFYCKAVPGVGGAVFAGVLSDKEVKGRGWGCGGEVNKLSAALSRSALVPVKDLMSSPNRSSSSSLELTVLPFCFLMYHFLCAIFCICSSVTLARFPRGRVVIMYIKRETKMPAFVRSRFVFIRLLRRHFKRNKITY